MEVVVRLEMEEPYDSAANVRSNWTFGVCFASGIHWDDFFCVSRQICLESIVKVEIVDASGHTT